MTDLLLSLGALTMLLYSGKDELDGETDDRIDVLVIFSVFPAAPLFEKIVSISLKHKATSG